MIRQRIAVQALLASVLLVAACSRKAATAKDQPKPVATAEMAESAPTATVELKPAKPAKPELPPIDPEKVPIEEDFVQDAEWRITRTTNLEKELQRLQGEIAQRGSGDAVLATKNAASAE